MKRQKIAVMGYGVVGSGVVEAFYNAHSEISRKISDETDIKYILDIVEHTGTPFDEKFISDFEIIVNDPEVTVVAEVIGGINPAYTFTKRCLEAGKSVVTSNKELVATKGAELLQIAKEHNVLYLFEASVGGGIPIIRPLRMCLIGNNIKKIAGIVNGTTNFILTKMFEDKMSFDDALSLAQKLGYAERNPAADIEGHDACRKICILSSLACGKHIYPEEIHTEGITKITSDDVSAASKLGYSIKLIAYFKQLENNKIQALVAPMMVPPENRLYNIKDVFNGVVVEGDSVGEVAFYGRGAGKLPTASAVVSDIIECVKFADVSLPLVWNDSDKNTVIDIKETSFSYCIRIKNTKGIKENLTALLGDCVYSCEHNDELLYVTKEITQKALDNAINKCENVCSYFRILK